MPASGKLFGTADRRDQRRGDYRPDPFDPGELLARGVLGEEGNSENV